MTGGTLRVWLYFKQNYMVLRYMWVKEHLHELRNQYYDKDSKDKGLCHPFLIGLVYSKHPHITT